MAVSAIKLTLENLSKTFAANGGSFTALAPVDLQIPTGRFVSLIGPSGCGKSTIFNIIAGLETPTTGRVLIDGIDATGFIGKVGYMLQKDLLLPWRTVLDNVALGLEIRGTSLAEARERALPLLQNYGLAGFESQYPAVLSGGMRQRAALLRTLLVDRDIVLLDEPFGALDAQTKSQMQDWLLKIFSEFGRTVVFVTHDVEEAVYLSDEIHVMASRPGRLVETLPIDLPRPRARSIVSTPRFVAMKKILSGSAATRKPSGRRRLSTKSSFFSSPVSQLFARGAKPNEGNRRRLGRCLPTRRLWPMWVVLCVQAGIFLGFIALWEVFADIGMVDAFFWSKPSAIASTFLVFFESGNAFVDIGYTFRSTIFGFALGTSLGAVLGMSFWWSQNYARIVQPLIICLESIPKLALAPLVILVFGLGLASKVAMATALTLVVSTLTTYAGVQAVDRDQEKLFYSLGASRWQVFTKLVAPSCVPWIISILRVNIGLALTGAIVGEFVASQYGLGRQILVAGQTYDIALVWVAVLVLSALSMVMYAAVSWIESALRKGVNY